MKAASVDDMPLLVVEVDVTVAVACTMGGVVELVEGRL
jgi:hypothetical protein